MIMMTPFAVVAAALLLAGCTGSNAPSSAPAPPSPPSASPAGSPASVTPAPTPTVTPATACAPAFPADTLPDTATASGGVLGLQAATAGPQPGYDRVVFTFAGTGAPGWRVEYVAAARSDGSGNAVSVAGAATLQVVLTAVGLPGDTGVALPTPRRSTPRGTTVVREVVLDGVFEGQSTAFIGVDRRRPFRATRLGGPPRVVVDIRHC